LNIALRTNAKRPARNAVSQNETRRARSGAAQAAASMQNSGTNTAIHSPAGSRMSTQNGNESPAEQSAASPPTPIRWIASDSVFICGVSRRTASPMPHAPPSDANAPNIKTSKPSGRRPSWTAAAAMPAMTTTISAMIRRCPRVVGSPAPAPAAAAAACGSEGGVTSIVRDVTPSSAGCRPPTTRTPKSTMRSPSPASRSPNRPSPAPMRPPPPVAPDDAEDDPPPPPPPPPPAPTPTGTRCAAYAATTESWSGEKTDTLCRTCSAPKTASTTSCTLW
jgi:hypothetical protein